MCWLAAVSTWKCALCTKTHKLVKLFNVWTKDRLVKLAYHKSRGCISSFLTQVVICNAKNFFRHFLGPEECSFVKHCLRTCMRACFLVFFFFQGFNLGNWLRRMLALGRCFRHDKNAHYCVPTWTHVEGESFLRGTAYCLYHALNAHP